MFNMCVSKILLNAVAMDGFPIRERGCSIIVKEWTNPNYIMELKSY